MIASKNKNVNTEKQWQILPIISDEFIKKYPEYSRLVLQMLFNRGLVEKEEIEEFLTPQPPFGRGDLTDASPLQRGGKGGYRGGDMHDPFLFNNMEAAMDLIIKHIKEGSKIIIYGDYDADGVTSTAILIEILTTLKANLEPYIPDRVTEGYGLNKKAISDLAKNGAKLIITVDGGIRSKEEVKLAKGLGLDVIITDHHVAPEKYDDLPDCLIVNPLVAGEKYPYKKLAGAGVAFKVAKALISKSTLPKESKNKLEEKILDLVAIGTVADCVSLIGENRNLVKRGLEVLNNTNLPAGRHGRVGLKELISIAEIKVKIDSWNIAFQIAPRLNAAGRMDHANTAFELLVIKNKEEAQALARRLNEKNIDRQRITKEIVEQISSDFEQSAMDDKIIIAVSPRDNIWNEGVIGLAAGKLSERYYRPALVITRGEEGLKGSGRSIDEFNIMEAIEECAEFLEKYGGHPAACGFSLKEENLEKFSDKIKKIAMAKLAEIDLKPKIIIEAELKLNSVDEELINSINQFAPFGEDNERPKFASFGAKIVDIFNMGADEQHIKIRIKDSETDSVKIISAIGFGQSEQWKELKISDIIDIVYYIEMNEFNGKRDAQLKIIDIKTITDNS
jgi:single-stranded-DNA-specific exonuclease